MASYDGSFLPYCFMALACALFGTAFGLNLNQTVIVAIGLTSVLHRILIKVYTARYNRVLPRLPQLKKDQIPDLVIYVPNFFCPGFMGYHVLRWLWGKKATAVEIVTARTSADIEWALRTASPGQKIALVGIGTGASLVLDFVSTAATTRTNLVYVVAIQCEAMNNHVARLGAWAQQRRRPAATITLPEEWAKKVIYATDFSQPSLLADLPQSSCCCCHINPSAPDDETILSIVRAIKDRSI